MRHWPVGLYDRTGLVTDLRSRSATQRPLVIAHRGASLAAPENTLPAFERAIVAGAEMIETDARLTADGQVILIHDNDLGRVTGSTGRVDAMSAAEVRALDAGYVFRSRRQNGDLWRNEAARIPLLDELLDLLDAHRHRCLNLELKSDGDDRRTCDLASAAIAVLRRRRMLRRTLISSFDPAALRAARAVAPQVATAALPVAGEDAVALLDRAASARHAAIHPNDALLGDGGRATDIVADAHRRGLRVHVWTVDDEQRMRTLLVAGIDGIITNDPGRLRRVVDERHPIRNAASRC